MSNNETYKTKLSPASIAAQVITIGLLFVFWQLGQKWVAIPAVLILAFLFLMLPRVIKKREVKFHQQALRLLATGKAAAVPELAQKQILLQLFGASAPVDGKLGLAYVHIGEYAAAIPCLDNAISSAPPIELPALLAGLTKSLFVTGDPARAETEGRLLVDKGGPQIAEPLTIIARARLGLGKTDPQTGEYLKQAQSLSASKEEQLMTLLTDIEWHLAHGKKPPKLPDNADSTHVFVRAWIKYVRGKLKEQYGKPEDAMKHYAKGVKLGHENPNWFSNLAHERLEALSKKHPSQTSDDSTSLDDAVRRKKKKRR